MSTGAKWTIGILLIVLIAVFVKPTWFGLMKKPTMAIGAADITINENPTTSQSGPTGGMVNTTA